MTSVFQGRSFLAEKDFTRAELEYLIGLSAHLKDLKKRNIEHHYLAGKNIALLFEKTSTRTRSAFTAAAIDLGAHPEYLGANDIQLGKKESTCMERIDRRMAPNTNACRLPHCSRKLWKIRRLDTCLLW